MVLTSAAVDDPAQTRPLSLGREQRLLGSFLSTTDRAFNLVIIARKDLV